MKIIPKYAPMAICRIDPAVHDAVRENRDFRAILLSAILTIIVGSMCLGIACGIWRSPMQALYSAIKMPALILSVALTGSLINTMLAQVMGTGLSFRQVVMCQSIGFAISSAWLGGISPVLLLFSVSAPSPTDAAGPVAYRQLLTTLTVLVAIAGLWGNIRTYQLLYRLTGSQLAAVRLLLTWILVTGLTGCELSWIMSPFLARPDLPVPFLNPYAFSSNFFEYLWKVLVQ